MTRKLLVSSFILLAGAAGAQAQGIVPGSDTSVRAQDTAGVHAVTTGRYLDGARDPFAGNAQAYGYPATGRATVSKADRFDGSRDDRPTLAQRGGVIVPGSDGF